MPKKAVDEKPQAVEEKKEPEAGKKEEKVVPPKPASPPPPAAKAVEPAVEKPAPKGKSLNCLAVVVCDCLDGLRGEILVRSVYRQRLETGSLTVQP